MDCFHLSKNMKITNFYLQFPANLTIKDSLDIKLKANPKTWLMIFKQPLKPQQKSPKAIQKKNYKKVEFYDFSVSIFFFHLLFCRSGLSPIVVYGPPKRCLDRCRFFLPFRTCIYHDLDANTMHVQPKEAKS